MEALTQRLSPDQRSRFLRNGYLVLKDVLSAKDLQPLVDEIRAVIDQGARDA